MVKNIEMYFISVIIQFLLYFYHSWWMQNVVKEYSVNMLCNLLKYPCCIDIPNINSLQFILSNLGVWRSWLARAVWDREVEGSSPFTPTMRNYCFKGSL